jgi:hypothetical protein
MISKSLGLVDGIQISNAIYALSLVIAYAIGTSTHREVLHLAAIVGLSHLWFGLFLLYIVAGLSCIWLRNDRFQVSFCLVSICLWCTTGTATILAPHYIAASGIFELLLATTNVVMLYFQAIG